MHHYEDDKIVSKTQTAQFVITVQPVLATSSGVNRFVCKYNTVHIYLSGSMMFLYGVLCIDGGLPVPAPCCPHTTGSVVPFSAITALLTSSSNQLKETG